eukprot:121414-Heterocapsa_arctica.AAC.1
MNGTSLRNRNGAIGQGGRDEPLMGPNVLENAVRRAIGTSRLGANVEAARAPLARGGLGAPRLQIKLKANWLSTCRLESLADQ